MRKPRQSVQLFTTLLLFCSLAQAQSQSSSPAEKRIVDARKSIAANPRRPQGYNDLCLALIRRARETADPAWYGEAGAALDAGLRLAPEDFELHKTQVALLLGRDEYAQALAEATKLNSKSPDDVTVYGYMAEADLALGNYPEAEKAAQWMLNLRRNNVAGLLAGAQLRTVYGDSSGALDFLNQAFGETPQTEAEELAFIANRMATIELDAGQLPAAEHTLDRAEQLFPGSPQITDTMARLRMEQHRPGEAVSLLGKRLNEEAAAHISQTKTLFLLASAQQAGGAQEAAGTWARFESSALAESTQPSNENALLILYEAGLPGLAAHNAALAEKLATAELTRRHDVATLDAVAWAQYANGRYAEAQATLAKALAVGVRRAQYFDHAGEIARALHQDAEASKEFAAALNTDPASAFAEDAARRLGTAPAFAANASATSTPALTELPAAAAVESRAQADGSPVPLQEVHDAGELPTALLVPHPTGTDRAIKKMQAQVAARPEDAMAYAGLGAALEQRARETGDVEDFQLAEQALGKSLDLNSTDISASAPLATLAAVYMGEHRFADALDYAQRSLALGSGDLSPFAIVGDAYADMGAYEKAGIAYARLQPVTSIAQAGQSPGRDGQGFYGQEARTAYLSFVSGDTGAAVREMQAAVSHGIEAHLPAENLAWLYFELGEFHYQSGQIDPAADDYLTALTVYPGNYRALAGLGKVRASQGKYTQAIALYQSAIAVVPFPIYIAELGDIYAHMGDTANADKQYKLVEYIGLLGHINQVLHNRDLALFYADHDRNLPEALELAHKEFEVRSDIYTWDALAWALYKNGKNREAQDAMSHALRLGTRDATLRFHAGMIAAALGQSAEAAKQLGTALAINPHFQLLYAAVAQKQLDLLQSRPALASATGEVQHAAH